MTHSDVPLVFTEAATDWLDRGPSVQALRRLLDSPALATPLVIGVYGGWGTGKTSVMQTLEASLTAPQRLILWFDAWVYARQEQALWRALLLRVVEALRERTLTPEDRNLQGAGYDTAKQDFDALWISPKDAEDARQELEEARASLYRSLTVKEQGGIRVNWWGALPLAADAALTTLTAGLNREVAHAIAGKDAEGGITTALAKWFKGKDTQEAVKLIEREASERYVDQLTSLEQFQDLFKKLLGRFRIGDERRLFVFVDDLDRCLPEDAVAALEAIKLFLDIKGCVFVLGMDREVVEQGIRVRYASFEKVGFDARAYLDKIIQVPFNLPPLGSAQISQYLGRLSDETGGAAVTLCRDLIRAAAPPNPRALKRVLNSLLLTLYLDGHDDDSLKRLQDQGDKDRARRLAKLVLLQVCFDEAWRALVNGVCSIKDAEKFVLGSEMELLEETKKLFHGSRLEALFRAAPRFDGLTDDEIAGLMTLSKVTSSE
jgi:hypothetical protein